MILHTRSALNSPKVSEECQGYKLDFLEAQICLQQMLCQLQTWRVQRGKTMDCCW